MVRQGKSGEQKATGQLGTKIVFVVVIFVCLVLLEINKINNSWCMKWIKTYETKKFNNLLRKHQQPQQKMKGRDGRDKSKLKTLW